VVQDVAAKDAVFVVDQEVPAAEDAVEEDEVKRHDVSQAPASIEGEQLIALAGERGQSDTLDRSARQECDVGPSVQQQKNSRD